MSFANIAPRAAAAIAAFLFVSAVPIVAYALLVTSTVVLNDDFGGPLNFLLIPLIGAACALILTIVYMLLFEVALRFRFGLLIVPVAIASAVFAASFAALSRPGSEAALVQVIAALLTAWIAGGSVVYFLVAVLGRRVAMRLAKRVPNKPQPNSA